MKILFFYCYYKLSRFFDKWDFNWGEKDGHVSGSLTLFASIGFYVLTMITICLHFMNKELSSELITIVLTCFCILSIPFIRKKKYKELEEYYKDEKHSKLKGWLVFLFAIGSVALFIISINMLDV